jgi:kumamolisin
MKTHIEPPKIPKDFVFSKELDSSVILDIKFIKNRETDKCEIVSMQKIITKYGLTLVTSNSLFVQVTGTYSSFLTMLNTRIYEFIYNGIRYYSYTSCIKLPLYMSFVIAILGFDNFPCAQTRAVSLIGAAPYTPIQVANLYNYPNKDGSGQSVAIIALGGGFILNDLNTYFSNLSLTTPTINSISVDNAINNPYDKQHNNNIELVTSIEIIGAIANKSVINIYFAPNTSLGFYDAIYSAMSDSVRKPKVISIGWGAPEYNWTSNNMMAFDILFQYGITNNINTCVPSGDFGSADIPGSIHQNVDFPASSPNVTSCGGTKLVSDGTTIQKECVWYYKKRGSGGGHSKFFEKPVYQNGIQLIKQYRGVPDCAANADKRTGYSIYVHNKNIIVGGTSTSTALTASLILLLNQIRDRPIGFLNNYLYNNNVCKDIIYGDNGYYKATLGWDECSGMGRIDGLLILPYINPY